MRDIIRTSMIAMLLTAALSLLALAQDARQLAWDDLIQKVEFEDPFETLTPDQLRDLSLVARIRGLQAAGNELDEGMTWEALEATVGLEGAGIDIDGLLARRDEIRELRERRAYAVVNGLNGQQVRMPGYALPLEVSANRVTEFLLVPWVGACIHTPPPPPNQIVYVKSDQGIEIPSRFSPVWVSGEMAVKAAKKNLFLVDGSTGIDVGYSLQATLVEPYEQ